MALLRKWWWLIVALLVVIIGVGYAVLGEPPNRQMGDTNVALVEFKGADVKQEDNGRLVWRLTADKIMMNPVTKVLYLENAEALFTDGEHQIHVKADKGQVDNATKQIQLEGSIEVRGNNGIYVKAANLAYDGKKDLLTADKGIRLERDGMVLTGDRLVADRGLKQARVIGHARLVKGG